MGRLSKFISLRASPQDLWLWKFYNHPILKIVILRREKFCSPERGSKVVKFTKYDRLDVLIILVRDEQFLFCPWKWSKGGTIGWFFLTGWKLQVFNFLLVSHMFSSEYDFLSTQKKISLYIQTHKMPVQVLCHKY